MFLTRSHDYGNIQITSTAVFGGLAAFNRILRHNAPFGAFFYGQAGTGYLRVCQLRKFTGLLTCNRLTTSLAALGQVFKWNLKMTKALIAPSSRPLTLNHTVNHEPRILDIEIAASLGLARPRDIRDVIIKNKEELESLGSIAVTNRAYRGHPITEYWLNEAQALLICMFSRTPKAAAVRKQVIEVFMTYRAGQSQSRALMVQPTTTFKCPTMPRKQAVTWQDLEALLYSAFGKDKANPALQALTHALEEALLKKEITHVRERNKASEEFYATQRKLAA
jgi:hypothetical protein